MSDDREPGGTGLRLQKVLARAGIASRRRAEELILEGRVSVDGQIVRTLGTRVDPELQVVTVDGQRIRQPKSSATVVLNKPMGVVSTMSDPEGRRTVHEILEEEPFRLVPVGRLDFNSEGVLLLSTDGELIHRLLHPSFKAAKIYAVRVKGQPRSAALDALRQGVELEDGRTGPCEVEVLAEEPKHTWLEFVLVEGRNRQIRRMCEAIGHEAVRVVRTAFAGIDAEGLRPGQYAYLAGATLERLYRSVDLAPPKEVESIPGVRGRAERRKAALPGDEPKGRHRVKPDAPRSAGRGRPIRKRRPGR